MNENEYRLLKPGDHVRAKSGNLYRVRYTDGLWVRAVRIREGLPYGPQRRLQPSALTLALDFSPKSRRDREA